MDVPRIIALSGAIAIVIGTYLAITLNPIIIGILIAIAGMFAINAAITYKRR